MHIYFNGQEIKFNHLEDKPGKKGYKVRAVPNDHPWRRWNQKIKDNKQRNYLAAVLGNFSLPWRQTGRATPSLRYPKDYFNKLFN
jgi:hypothetical protein